MFGMSAEIQVPRMERCERCKGAGSEPGSGPSNCPTCHGRGEILYQQSFLSIRRTCSTCNGSGQIIRNPCTECHGHGYRQVQRKLKVNIPAGVDDGNRLRLAGEGQPGGNGGPPGDLYVFLKVKEHAFFERHENDLHCTIPLNVAQAALGCEIEVPTLGQPHKLKIPEGTQNGAQFKLRHQGVAILNSSAPRRSVRPYQRQDAHAPHPRAAQAARTVARYPSGGQPAQPKKASSIRSKTTSCNLWSGGTGHRLLRPVNLTRPSVVQLRLDCVRH